MVASSWRWLAELGGARDLMEVAYRGSGGCAAWGRQRAGWGKAAAGCSSPREAAGRGKPGVGAEEGGGLGLFGVGLGVELAWGAVGPGGAGFDPLAEGADFHVGEGDLEAGHHALVETLAGDGFEEEGLVGFAGDDVGATGGAWEEGEGVVGEVEEGGIGAAVTGEAVFFQDGFDVVGEEFLRGGGGGVLGGGAAAHGENRGGEEGDPGEVKRGGGEFHDVSLAAMGP
jgi:hypothetical protein